MRYSVNGGNGCKCDMCGKILTSDLALKVKIFKKNPNDSTGYYDTIGKIDMCESCYMDMLYKFVQPPRKNKDNK